MIAKLDEYQELAIKTAGTFEDPNIELAVLTLGLSGEAGEVTDIIKKVLGHGHPRNDEKLKKELGDVLWYIAVLAKFLDISMSDIATTNIEKLKTRYPEGFSTEKSLNRSELDK